MKKIITLGTFIMAAYVAAAQVAPSWVRFPAPSNFQNYDAFDVSAGTDTLGNIYTSASVSDTTGNFNKTMMVKHNSAGTQQWIKYFGGVASDAYAVATLVDKAGNSYMCGYSYVTSNGADFTVIKYDNAGTQLWIKTWDGGQQERDYITSATFDKAGNIIVAGNANFQGSAQYDMAMVKFSTAGTQLASYIYNNNAINLDDVVKSVACDGSNNFFLTGHSYGTSGREMITIKLNSTGTMQWIKTIPHSSSNDESGYSVVADAAGNCYVTGATSDWITIKYDPAGTSLWTNHYTQNALNTSNMKKIMLDKHNDVIITGDAFFGGGNSSDLVISKLNNATGTQTWSSSYNFGGSDGFRSAALDTAGNVYICGRHDGPLGTDLIALAVSSAGITGWNTTYTSPSPATGIDDGYQLVLDKDRNVIIVGTAETRGTSSSDAVDVIVLKYNAFTVGIKTNSLPELQLTVFPNPCTDHFTITSFDHDLKGADITVMNAIGQTLIKETWISETHEISTAQLPKGMYLVTITKGETSTAKRFVVQ